MTSLDAPGANGPPVTRAAALRIEPLCQHKAWLPEVARWFVAEWPGWYGPGGQGDVSQDLQAFAASADTLPLGLLALQGDQPVGAAALKAESIPSHRHLGPWAAAGYVRPGLRGQGVGAALLAALRLHAQRLGHPQLYCGTATANRLLLRSGWTVIDSTVLDGKLLQVFACATAVAPDTVPTHVKTQPV